MTISSFKITLTTGAIFALSMLASGAASAQDSAKPNSYDTASLQNFSAQLSQESSFAKSSQSRSDAAVGLGLNYTVKFGENVAASETYGSAGLNFNTNWQGKSGQASLATLSFGSKTYAGYDRFGLVSAEDQAQKVLTLNVLGIDLDKLGADDNNKKTKTKKGTDLGDVGLLAGGVGLLLLGGTVAVLAVGD